PHAGIVRIEVLKILRQALEVDRRQLAFRVRGLLHLRATLSCPAATAGLSSCGWARSMPMPRLNSLTRRLFTDAALTSTRPGFCRKGEPSRLRIRCETRAFDCA